MAKKPDVTKNDAPKDAVDALAPKRKVKRQSGSIMILALIVMIGLFALVSPSAISSTIERNTDNAYDSDDTYDLKLSYSLGFTDSDISALQYAECIESISPYAEGSYTVSEDSAIEAVNVYPELYAHVTGAKRAVALSDEYRQLVNAAREYIEVNIEPSLSAARVQYLRSGLTKELGTLSETLDSYAERDKALDEELVSLSENYAQAMEDFESEQESINEAKSAIQARERSAQSTIESGKQNLTSVLNEVYSKSVVTAADINKAQGLSNYVSGSEKSLHNQFTSEWAELADIETHLHEDEVALKENKEARELEIAEEKEQLVRDADETKAKMEALESQLDIDSGRWVIEDRSIIPAYSSLSASDSTIKSRYTPIGIFIYLLCLIGSLLLVISIVTRNTSRISSWKQRGLGDRIIAGFFIRKTALAAAIGAVLGALIGCVVSPIAYMYSYAEMLGIPFSGLGIAPLAPILGTICIVTVASATCMLTFNINSKNYKIIAPEDTAVETKPAVAPPDSNPVPAPVPPKPSISYEDQKVNQKKGMLKIDMLQESMLNTYGIEDAESKKKSWFPFKFNLKKDKTDAIAPADAADAIDALP